MSLLQSCSFCFAHIYWWWFHITKQCTVLSSVIWALIIIKREHREVVRVQEGRRGKQWSWKTNVIVYKVIARVFQGSVLSSSTLKSAHSEQKTLIWMVTFHRMAATLMWRTTSLLSTHEIGVHSALCWDCIIKGGLYFITKQLYYQFALCASLWNE